MDRPRKATANSSDGPNLSATLAKGWVSSNMQMEEKVPPMAEVISAMPSALPASPRCAMG